MASFEEAVKRTLRLEGGYANNPADKGGETNWGITVKTARAYGYQAEMKAMKKEDAVAIYKKGYWDSLRLDEVASQLIAENLFDMNVNGGPAVRYAQRVLNAINTNERGQVLWPDITEDGEMGNLTLAALNAVVRKDLPRVNPSFMEELFCVYFNALRGVRFLDIIKHDKSQKVFSHGWGAHRVLVNARR
jgi:lysozyme family protein